MHFYPTDCLYLKKKKVEKGIETFGFAQKKCREKCERRFDPSVVSFKFARRIKLQRNTLSHGASHTVRKLDRPVFLSSQT